MKTTKEILAEIDRRIQEYGNDNDAGDLYYELVKRLNRGRHDKLMAVVDAAKRMLDECTHQCPGKTKCYICDINNALKALEQ